jgi:butyryl-CoA dehydrogenase
MQSSISAAARYPELQANAQALAAAIEGVGAATRAAWASGEPTEALSNAMAYMQAFGHTVIAWIWLDVTRAALRQLASGQGDADFLRGKLQAMRYFYAYELPQTAAWLTVVSSCDPVCREMRDEWF